MHINYVVVGFTVDRKVEGDVVVVFGLLVVVFGGGGGMCSGLVSIHGVNSGNVRPSGALSDSSFGVCGWWFVVIPVTECIVNPFVLPGAGEAFDFVGVAVVVAAQV